MLKKFVVLIAIVIFLLPIVSSAGPLYRATKQTVLCDNPGSEKILFDVSASPAGSNIPSECHQIPPGYQFEAYSRQNWYSPGPHEKSVLMIYGRMLKTESSVDDKFFNILAADTEPVLDSAGNMLDAPCTNMIGGEIDRMEADEAGRLYLKRYRITSKCVNGRVVTSRRRLN